MAGLPCCANSVFVGFVCQGRITVSVGTALSTCIELFACMSHIKISFYSCISCRSESVMPFNASGTKCRRPPPSSS